MIWTRQVQVLVEKPYELGEFCRAHKPAHKNGLGIKSGSKPAQPTMRIIAKGFINLSSRKGTAFWRKEWDLNLKISLDGATILAFISHSWKDKFALVLFILGGYVQYLCIGVQPTWLWPEALKPSFPYTHTYLQHMYVPLYLSVCRHVSIMYVCL